MNIFFFLAVERKSVRCYSVDKPWKHVKWKKPVTKEHILYMIPIIWNSPGKNTGVGSHYLLQGIFLPQGLKPGLLHCRQILYHMSHQGRPLNNLTFISPVSAQLLSRVQLFVTPWMAACQASLSITNSQSLLKLMSIGRWCHPTISSSVVPFSSCSQSFTASESFPMSCLFVSRARAWKDEKWKSHH